MKIIDKITHDICKESNFEKVADEIREDLYIYHCPFEYDYECENSKECNEVMSFEKAKVCVECWEREINEGGQNK